MGLEFSKPQDKVIKIPIETLTIFTLGKSIAYKDTLDLNSNFRW